MIVVDTSVWVTALRRATAPEADALRALLDADEAALAVPVRVELLAGASGSDRPRLRRALSALPVIHPTDGTWTIVEDWAGRASRRGQRFGFADLLVGALATEHGARLWSLDSDFARMETLGFLRRYLP